ncbi:MAG: trypsin-like peptidase domain-containing protein, partial [Candidatus Obscuribacterales bacterium]|nr:trypsin-like peptidase domain-containing protein [Candidatus Obscuribacterales bacterium]
MATPNPINPENSELASTIDMAGQDVRTKAAKRLLEDVRGSVVTVTAGKDNEFTCDGFFINDGTEVVTSNSIFQSPEDMENIHVLTSKGELLSAKIEKRQDGRDEVVLKLPVKAGKGLPLGLSDDLVESEGVFLYGTRDLNSPAVLAAGRMKSHYRDRAGDTEKLQFLDCLMPPGIGKPGSPLLNSDGEVVGVYRSVLPFKPAESKNIFVKFDDVYELQVMLDPKAAHSELASSGAEADESVETVETAKPVQQADKPTAEQLEAIEAKFGKITKPTVIDFSADWCPACQKLEPVLDKAEKENGDAMKVVRINYDKDKD